MSGFSFGITNTDGMARRGHFSTPHGKIDTPAFMPVGTHGTVRGLTMQELRAADAQMILSNAYHLSLRPGDQAVRALGGLHAFARWTGPMLTDSGGYQVFSLSRYRKISEEGVEFRSKLDGSTHYYTPERVIQIERNIGADVIMQFDELIAGGSSYELAKNAMERSLRWLNRCKIEFDRIECDGREPLDYPVTGWHELMPESRVESIEGEVIPPSQALFPIVQGGTWNDLRRASIEGILSIGDWVGIAVGGLSVGESKESMYETFDQCSPRMPFSIPRYLMGVGFPDDLLEAVARGMDLFDCVAPTRMGRHGTVFTRDGKIQVQKSNFRADGRPLTDYCLCSACTDYDRAYLRHLMVTDEPLGPRLLALHNLTFILNLMRETRLAIDEHRFSSWSTDWLLRYREGQAARKVR